MAFAASSFILIPSSSPHEKYVLLRSQNPCFISQNLSAYSVLYSSGEIFLIHVTEKNFSIFAPPFIFLAEIYHKKLALWGDFSSSLNFFRLSV